MGARSSRTFTSRAVTSVAACGDQPEKAVLDPLTHQRARAPSDQQVAVEGLGAERLEPGAPRGVGHLLAQRVATALPQVVRVVHQGLRRPAAKICPQADPQVWIVPGSCLPPPRPGLSGGPGEGGPLSAACLPHAPSRGRHRAARNGTPARRDLLVAQGPWWEGCRAFHQGGCPPPPTESHRPVTAWSPGGHHSAGHAFTDARTALRPSAWWVGGDAPSMDASDTRGGPCSHGAPARRAAPRPASSERTRE